MKSSVTYVLSASTALGFLLSASAVLGFASRLDIEVEKSAVMNGLLSVESVGYPARK